MYIESMQVPAGNTVTFESVSAGQTFYYNNDWFIKVMPNNSQGIAGGPWGAKLSNGEIINFSSSTQVQPAALKASYA